MAYQINLISYDLSREETMLQIANALEQVENISVDIMRRIETKANEFQNRVTSLNERIGSAQTKIDSLKNRTNKAVTVFAQPKYPDPLSEEKYFDGLFFEINEPKPLNFGYEVHSRPNKPDIRRVLEEKQLHYSVKIAENVKNENIFGPLPKNLDSVSNLLVFNTSFNPYEQSDKFEDPFGAKAKTRQNQENETSGSVDIGAAPESITNKDLNERNTLETFTYTPSFGEVPEFDVPDLLPDLPGIADLTYSVDLPSISAGMPSFESLPEIPGIPKSDAHSSSVLSPTSVHANIPAPPPPPPPPPPVSLQIVPPPPPPPPAPPVMPQPAAPAVPASEMKPAEPAESRSSLMDAIRRAGGSEKFKFRSAVEERKREKKLKREEEKESGGVSVVTDVTSGGGDLMSDLNRALLLRRKAISGRAGDVESSKSQKGLGSGALAKISQMIPSPSKEKIEHHHSDHEEWSE